MGTRNSVCGDRADYSLPSSAGVKKDGTLPLFHLFVFLHGTDRDNFTFLYWLDWFSVHLKQSSYPADGAVLPSKLSEHIIAAQCKNPKDDCALLVINFWAFQLYRMLAMIQLKNLLSAWDRLVLMTLSPHIQRPNSVWLYIDYQLDAPIIIYS